MKSCAKQSHTDIAQTGRSSRQKEEKNDWCTAVSHLLALQAHGNVTREVHENRVKRKVLLHVAKPKVASAKPIATACVARVTRLLSADRLTSSATQFCCTPPIASPIGRRPITVTQLGVHQLFTCVTLYGRFVLSVNEGERVRAPELARYGYLWVLLFSFWHVLWQRQQQGGKSVNLGNGREKGALGNRPATALIQRGSKWRP